MLNIYFGGLTDDRLGRLGFLACWLLLVVLLVTAGLLAGFGLGVADHLAGPGPEDTQTHLRDDLGLPFILVIWMVGLAFLFAELNICAKRIRHIGLPGWPATIVAGVVVVLVALLVSQRLGQGLAVLAWLALVSVPGGLAGTNATRT